MELDITIWINKIKERMNENKGVVDSCKEVVNLYQDILYCCNKIEEEQHKWEQNNFMYKRDKLKVNKIIAEGIVGSHFYSVFENAKMLADFYETLVIFNFNGIDLVISPNSNKENVYDEYMQKLKEYNDGNKK
jgi:hypothetical protein